MDTGEPIIWRDEAREDLRDILHYLARFPTSYVDDWTTTLTRKLELISLHPQAGRMVPEKEITHLREVFVGRYRLIYIYLNGLITIIGLRPMSQPLGKI